MFLSRVFKTLQISSSVRASNAISISRHAAPSTPSSLQWKGLSVCAGDDSDFLRRDTFKKVAKIVAPFTVHLFVRPGRYVESETGTVGSGIMVDKNGTILTCAHVVTNARYSKDKAYRKWRKMVEVTLSDGTTHQGVTSSYDIVNDLALVKINPTSVPLTAAKAGDVNELHSGDLVMSAGSPRGWSFSFSKGIISSLDHTHKTLRDRRNVGNIYLQTDCGTAPGSSGGPIVNLKGEVIGVTVAGEAPGIAFGMRIDSVLRALKKMEYGDALSFTKGISLPSSKKKPKTRNK